MRAKTAKALRRMAADTTVGQPHCRYGYRKGNPRTALVDPATTRGVYLRLKRERLSV